MPYKDKEKQKEIKRRYIEKNKQKVRESVRRCYLRKNFGITLEEYNQMFLEQEGKCVLCGKHQTENGRALCVDHDHETGMVRGLLCNDCNVNKVGNNTLETAKKLVEYLGGNYG